MVIQSNLARGGPHAITHALARCFVHYGGSIFTDCPVTKINIQNGEAKGVVLSKNAVYPEAEIGATKAVISDLTMHPTFIDLVGLEHVPQYAEAIKAISYDAPVQFTAYWALNEPLDWSGAGFPKELDRAYGFNYGIDDWREDIGRAEKDWANHRPPNPPIACGLTVQSYGFVDPTQAPKGQYTVMSWAEACYDLDDYPNGGLAWDDIREDYGDKVEDLLASYVPNLKKAKVARYCETPLGYYRRNPSQIRGHWCIAKIPSQTGLNAPFPGCGAPRSPISKLYLVRYQGTCTTMDAGYKCADILAQDLGIRDKQDWWNVKVFEPQTKWLQRHGIDNRWTVD
jgi:phytoene dehydrogenase-like protein